MSACDDAEAAFENLGTDALALLFDNLLHIEALSNSFLSIAWNEVNQCMKFAIGDPPVPAPGCYQLWRNVITLDGAARSPIQHCFQFPSCSTKWNYFFRRFDAENRGRFMEVVINIHRSCDRSVFDSLIRDGITFGGRKYFFLQGEPLRQGSYVASCKAVFFAVCSVSEQPALKPVPIAALRSSLGRFAENTSPAKLNARLKLGLSSTHAVSFPSSGIVMIDDVLSSIGAVMTDGCGFISETYAFQLPRFVSNGIASLDLDDKLPAVIQMRLVCSLGLFKGCLIVTNDTALLRGHHIVLRRSMQKASAMEGVDDFDASFGVVDTFRYGAGKGERSCQLNQAFVFLLSSLAKDKEKLDQYFVNLMRDELTFISTATVDRTQAYKLVKQQLRSWNRRDDMDMFQSICFEAFSLLQAGFELTEPRVAYLLKHLQRSCIEKLKKCRMRLQDAAYLVGVPDPFGTLLPHEVFISLGSDVDGSDVIITGQVLTLRNPIYHGSEVCAMTAVADEKLQRHCSGRGGGVIYFSILGDQPRVDAMGGGDYDGDKYCVLFSNNPIVDMVKTDTVVPVANVAPVETPSANIAQMDHTDLSLAILNGLFYSSEKSLVGKYSHSWWAFADHPDYGPNHKYAIECAHIAATALDSAKSGKIVKASPSLLDARKNVAVPHFLARRAASTPTRRSTSIVGVLYDMACSEYDALSSATCASIVLDEDICVGFNEWKNEKWFKDALHRWKLHEMQYRESMEQFCRCEDADAQSDGMAAVKQHYSNLFLSDAAGLHTHLAGCSMPLAPCHRHELYLYRADTLHLHAPLVLASIIYTVTHANRATKQAHGSFSFAWTVCLQEIIFIKSHKMKKRLQQHPLDNLLRSESLYI